MKRRDASWLRTARVFAYESWWPPFWPHLEIDWDRALWTMQRLHLDTLQANALTKWATYQTNLMARHPELGDRDLVQEAQDFARKHGFRLIVYTFFGHAMPISTQLSKTTAALYRPMIPDRQPKPSWHRHTVLAEFQEYFTRFHYGGERLVAHCPFAAESWIMAMVGELADRFDYDAAWFDGSIEYGGYWVNDGFSGFWSMCACSACQEAYLADFRQPMPMVREPDDPRLLGMKRWVMRRLDALLSKAADRFTKCGKVPLVGNIAAGTATACFYPPILDNLDGGLLEHAGDQIELVRKISEGRQIVDVSFHYPDSYDPWPRKVTSGWEIENKGLTILAYGGTPYLAQPGKYYYDDSNDQPAQKLFSFMKEAKGLLSRQVRYAYCSVAFLPWFAPLARLHFQNSCVRGWVSAMLETHVPVTTMPFHLLEDQDSVSRHPVLILPAMDIMSEAMLRSIRQFVEKGGGVYLSVDPARLDENLHESSRELLREILDLQWQQADKQPTATLLRRCTFERDEPLGQTYDVYLKPDKRSSGDFPMPGEKIMPSRFGETVPGESWTVVAHLVPTDEERPLFPAIAIRKIGKGRLVFSTVPWEEQYEQRRDPNLGRWMHDIVCWLGQVPIPIQLSGSRLLNLGTTKVDDGWLLYLVNQSNDIQSLRRDWWDLMKVAGRPLPIGRVELRMPGTQHAAAIYGPEPDEISTERKELHVVYTDFRDHVVLHVH